MRHDVLVDDFRQSPLTSCALVRCSNITAREEVLDRIALWPAPNGALVLVDRAAYPIASSHHEAFAKAMAAPFLRQRPDRLRELRRPDDVRRGDRRDDGLRVAPECASMLARSASIRSGASSSGVSGSSTVTVSPFCLRLITSSSLSV